MEQADDGGMEWWQTVGIENNFNQSKENIMGRFASDTGGGDFVQAPSGSHVARCVKVTDLGTQTGEYEGKPTHRNQVLITWELPNELMDDGKPFLVSKFYTNSIGEKATLRHHLVSWCGREFTVGELAMFDLQTILGATCLISVVHSEKGKAKVDAVMRLPKGMECPPQINPSEDFWLDEFSQEKFDRISNGIQGIIVKSPEYAALSQGKQYQSQSGADKNAEASWAEIKSDIPF